MKRKYTELFDDTIKLLEQDKKDTLEIMEANQSNLLHLKDKIKVYFQESIGILNAAMKENKSKRNAYCKQIKKATACVKLAHDVTKTYEDKLLKEIEKKEYYREAYTQADAEVEVLEGSTANLQMSITDKDEEIVELKKRINFVDESKAINYADEKNNIKVLKSLISTKKPIIFELNEFFRDISECVDEHISDSSLCIICRSKRSQYAFNCGHLCVCESCFEKTKPLKQCPYCRKKSNGFKIFAI